MVEGIMIFDKWETGDVVVSDPGLINYINLQGTLTMHSHGRQAKKQFGKSDLNITERMVNNIMRSGSGKKVGGKLLRDRFGCGKKSAALATVQTAFDLIAQKTKENPLQVLVRAIENAAPREETTRVKFGGITRHIAVDIAPQRRIDFALRNIAISALGKSFKTTKSRAQVLADEILAAASNDTNAMSISKKIEVERVAKGAR